MRRGEVWTVAAGGGYAGKPRPVVIIQDDRFEATASVTVCAFTTHSTEAPLLRILVQPDQTNGLVSPSRLMIDKLTTAPRGRLGGRIGRLDETTMMPVNRALIVFLGLARAGESVRSAGASS